MTLGRVCKTICDRYASIPYVPALSVYKCIVNVIPLKVSLYSCEMCWCEKVF